MARSRFPAGSFAASTFACADFDEPGSRFQPRSPDEVRALYKAGAFDVLGEIMAQYEGIPP